MSSRGQGVQCANERCGQILTDDSIFCPKCGFRRPPLAPPAMSHAGEFYENVDRNHDGLQEHAGYPQDTSAELLQDGLLSRQEFENALLQASAVTNQPGVGTARAELPRLM